MQRMPVERIKVLFYLFFPGGGIGRYTHSLATEMGTREDVVVELACLPEFLWRNTKAYQTWPKLRSISHRLPMIRRVNFLVGQFVNPRRLYRCARETKPDVVHICNINHLSYPTWSSLIDRSGALLTVSVHDVRRAKAIVNGSWERRQLKQFYRRADALFVHGEAQREDLLSFSGCREERVHIVPHGLYDSPPCAMSKVVLREKYGIPLGRIVALVFGNLRDEKNLVGLLDAVASMKDNRVHLLIAGRDGGRNDFNYDYYRKKLGRLGLDDRVTLIDRYVSDDEISSLFSIADFCALPYSTTFTSQSGVLNTAVAHRTPVLATPCPMFVETLERFDIGVLCASDQVEAIRVGIECLIYRIDCSRAFQFDSYSRHYSWSKNASTTMEVYRKLIHERSMY